MSGNYLTDKCKSERYLQPPFTYYVKPFSILLLFKLL